MDNRYFYPEVYQAVAGEDYTVYVYMNDGGVRKFDAAHLVEKGGVFEPLRDKRRFQTALTVINHTVAWDLEGNRDEYHCIDIDPFELFQSPIVPDIPENL